MFLVKNLLRTQFNIFQKVQCKNILNQTRFTTNDVRHTLQFERPSDIKQKGEVFDNVNKILDSGKEGRLFAIIHLCGKQFKITDGDIIIVEGYWPPTIGDRIRFDKILLAAGNDFTLIGKPILPPDIVDIQGTIIEKTLSHARTNFRKKRRKQYMRINFHRAQNTMIRINSINVKGRIDDRFNENKEEIIFKNA